MSLAVVVVDNPALMACRKKDFDFGHNHGFGDPHAHDWLDGVRQNPGRPIGPNE
jgi:hypothetical protein